MNKEEFAQFRNECGSYFFYLSRLSELADKKKKLDYIAEGVRASDPARIISVSRRRSVPPVIAVMSRRDETEKEISEYTGKISWILNCISSIPNPALRPAVWMVFVQKKSFSEVAELYEMSAATLKRHVCAQFGQ